MTGRVNRMVITVPTTPKRLAMAPTRCAGAPGC